MKFGEKLKIVSKKNLIVNQYTIKKYLKAKIKSKGRKTHAKFQDNRIPREVFQFICLSVILIDSVFRTDKNYYPQVFLEECRYVVKEKWFLNILLTI